MGTWCGVGKTVLQCLERVFVCLLTSGARRSKEMPPSSRSTQSFHDARQTFNGSAQFVARAALYAQLLVLERFVQLEVVLQLVASTYKLLHLVRCTPPCSRTLLPFNRLNHGERRQYNETVDLNTTVQVLDVYKKDVEEMIQYEVFSESYVADLLQLQASIAQLPVADTMNESLWNLDESEWT
jgi:hypothetical protein